MQRYIAQRLLLALPTLVVISILIFSLIRMIPGDALAARIADAGFVSEEQLAAMRAELGIDRPFLTQYGTWAGGLLRGDLGDSLWTGRPVASILASRILVTGQIALMAILIGTVLAIPLGVLSAVRRGTPLDYGARLFAITGLAIPDFWIATVLLLVLSKWIGWLPEFGYVPIWEDWSKNLQALIFPAAIVGYRFSAAAARMTRSAMLEVLGEDYIRTARSKGLAEVTVVMRHALRNALIPVVTVLTTALSFMLGGLVITETIFSLPGMGRLVFEAVQQRDYPVLQGAVLLVAIIWLGSNLIVDLAYAWLNPRIRYT